MPRLAYVNGRYTPLAFAQVHVEDRGFQFGDGVYEYWSILGGNLISALVGVSVALLVSNPIVAASIAIAVAVALMMSLRCIS